MRKIAFFALWFACVAFVFAAEKPVLKIGVIAPLTGDASVVGEEIRNGVTLACEEYKGDVQLKVVYEDDQMQNAQINAAALKLIQADHVDVIISVWAAAADIISHHAQRYHVIDFNTGWDVRVANKDKWTLVHGGDYRQFSKKCVELIKAAKAKRVAIATYMHEGNIIATNDVLSLLKQEGIEVVFNENYPPGTRDFRTYMLKIRETYPDFFFDMVLPPEDGMLFRAQKELGLNWPTTGNFWVCDESLRPYIDGAVFPALWETDGFRAKYLRRFGHSPRMVEAANCYDIINITAQAASLLNKKLGRMPTHEELLDGLGQPKELPNLAVGPGRMMPGGWVESHYVLKQIKAGQIIDYNP